MPWLSQRYNYRVSFLIVLARSLLLPPLFSCLVCLCLSLRTRLAFWAFAILAVPTFWSIAIYRQAKQRTQLCHSLHVSPIPVILGKWPGNIDVFLQILASFATGYVADVFEQFFDQYGDTVNTRMFWDDQIFTRDHEVIHFLSTSGFDHFDKGDIQKARMQSLAGEGILNSDGATWRYHRSLARPFFIKSRVTDFDIFNSHSEKLTASLACAAELHKPVDIQDMFLRMTLDIGCHLLCGQELGTLDLPLLEASYAEIGQKASTGTTRYNRFAMAVDNMRAVIVNRGRLTQRLWPLVELWHDRSKEPMKTIHNWFDPLVMSAIERSNGQKRLSGHHHDDTRTLLDHLVTTMDDTTLLRDELINILLAARDTTASLLTYILYMLAMHPEAMSKARAEVIKYCPKGAPRQEDIKRLPFLRACINETLRLWPSIPLNEKSSKSTCILPSASGSRMLMPGPGIKIVYMPILMQRNKRIWGANAEDFIPDRWFEGTDVSDPKTFAPFGTGVRACLGQHMAYQEVSCTLIHLLQSFENFTLAAEAQPSDSLPPTHWKACGGRKSIERCWPQSSLSLLVKGGLWVRMTPFV